jgi:Protein of unknown function (DUF2510)
VRWQWLVIVIVALLGAAGGAYLGDRVAPDVVGVLASLAVVGFGVGALVGVIVSGWWRPPPKPPAASGAIEETEFTARAQEEPTHGAEAEPEPEHAAALVEHPPPPPPPDGGEPGWYSDHEGVRRYWDGERWTEIVWRERQARSRKR